MAPRGLQITARSSCVFVLCFSSRSRNFNQGSLWFKDTQRECVGMTFPQVILLSGASLFHALPFAQVAAVMPKSWSSANHRQTLRIGHKPCVRLSGSELGTWQRFDLRPQQTGMSTGTAYASLPVPRSCQAALLTNVLWRNCIKINFSQAVLLPDSTFLAVLFSLSHT